MAESPIPAILVVDDNPATLYSTSRILRAAGYKVIEAVTGQAAIDSVIKGVDAVVLDVNLPDISGFEVCRRLRATPTAARVPVIHLSASFVKDVDKVTGLEAGADGYLTHPVEPPVLIATLNAFLRARSAEAERERLLISEQAARTEAERANQLKDEFLATLSHELRTPLNAIVGWAQVLKKGAADPQELAEGLDAIERNAKAQNDLISDLLDVSRIVSGKLRLEVQPVSPAAVIDAAIDGIKPAVSARNIHIARMLDNSPLTVSGDASRLQQVMWNLLSNAVKFTPQGGSISITLRRTGLEAEIAVTDNGSGIDPQLLPHIFDRFRQGDASTTRAHGGLGLGLSIVKHLVEMHGGSVNARSDGIGKGATFIVTLPLAVVPPVATQEARGYPAFSPSATTEAELPNLEGLRILLVDDDHDSRALLRRVLREVGASIVEARSSAEALDKIQAESPSVMISDIGMPSSDGYELIRQVRGTGLTAQALPAIALTAFARSEDRRRAMLAGYQLHLAKPVDVSELIAAIGSLSGRASQPAKS